MPLFGQKTGFSARMNEIKSGIPRSAPRWWFCITACKTFTNTKASSLNQPTESNASHRSVVQGGEHKLRDFRTPYLRKPIEYM
jgi:hypothetical protein